MVVVKADAYGHGAVAITRRAVADGAYMVGVGDSHEALELREAGITVPFPQRDLHLRSVEPAALDVSAAAEPLAPQAAANPAEEEPAT